MALTEAQRLQVRLFLGWQDGFGQFDSRLEQAMNHVDNRPELLALVTNAIDGTPPGLLACLQDIDTKLRAAHGRFKATVVGSLTLNPAEKQQLRSEGSRFVKRLAAILGVEVRSNPFSSGGGGSSNFVGK